MHRFLADRRLQILTLMVALGVYLGGAVVGVFRSRTENNDFELFAVVAACVFQRGDLPSDNPLWRYPPTAYPWIAVLGLFPRPLMEHLWPVLSILAIALATASFARVLTDDPLLRFWLVVLSLLVGSPFLLGDVALGQITAVMIAGTLLSWRLIERGRDRWGGLLLGVLTAVKVFPGFVLLYLLVKRKWRPLAWAGAAVVFSTALAAAVLGPGELKRASLSWYDDVLVEGSARRLIFRPDDDLLTGLATNYHNQALPAVLARLVQAKNAGGFHHPIYVNVVNWPSRTVWTLYLLIELCVLAALVWFWRRPWGGTSPDRRRAEFAVAVLAPLLFLPHVLTYFFALTHLVVLILLLRASDPSPRVRSVAAATLLLWIASLALLSLNATRAAGATLWATCMLGVCFVFLETMRQTAAGAIGEQRTPPEPDLRRSEPLGQPTA